MTVRLFIEAGHEKTQEYVFLDTLIQYLGFARKQYEIICVGGKNNLVKAANKFKDLLSLRKEKSLGLTVQATGLTKEKVRKINYFFGN